jgi:RHS repeat-associated protein
MRVNACGGTPPDVFRYTYNADGELTAVSDDNSPYQYAYNADGEETSQADVGSPDLPTVTLTYEYDADGNRTAMDDSEGGLVSFTYDARDELTNETLSGSGISAEAVKNVYDNAGNMTGQTRYSNTAETNVVATTSYTYDDAEQMTGITDKNSGGTTLVSYGYTYDAASLVSAETRGWASGSSTDTLDYTYTNNDQLTGVTHTNGSLASESFSYDANGNETGDGYTTSTGNEQTASPGYTYTYDANGNMITSTATSTGDVWTYSYNFRGLMTGAVEKTSGGTVLAQITYTYDALDNRIGMDENGTQTWTLYDGSDPIMDFNSSGSLEMRYLNGPTGDLVDSVIARESSGGTVAWYLPDRLGTIRDLINNSGSIIDHIDFSAFGTALDESSPSNGDRMMGFGGMERDTVTGMNLAVNRVQDPGTGRWTSQDPLNFASGDVDLYRFVGNSPSNVGDPSGLDAKVTVDNNNSVLIQVPVDWNGDGVTEERKQNWIKGIEKEWTGKFGKYNVVCKVIQRAKGDPPNTVTVDIGGNLQEAYTTKNHHHTYLLEDSSPWVAAHEFGHLMKLPDRYTRNPDRTTTPDPKWKGTIMAEANAKPCERDITQIIELNR